MPALPSVAQSQSPVMRSDEPPWKAVSIHTCALNPPSPFCSRNCWHKGCWDIRPTSYQGSLETQRPCGYHASCQDTPTRQAKICCVTQLAYQATDSQASDVCLQYTPRQIWLRRSPGRRSRGRHWSAGMGAALGQQSQSGSRSPPGAARMCQGRRTRTPSPVQTTLLTRLQTASNLLLSNLGPPFWMKVAPGSCYMLHITCLQCGQHELHRQRPGHHPQTPLVQTHPRLQDADPQHLNPKRGTTELPQRCIPCKASADQPMTIHAPMYTSLRRVPAAAATCAGVSSCKHACC